MSDEYAAVRFAQVAPSVAEYYHASHQHRAWNRSAALLVVLLHGVFLFLLASGMRGSFDNISDVAMEVEWIRARPDEVTAPIPPWPRLPEHASPRVETAPRDASSVRESGLVESQAPVVGFDVIDEVRLFDGLGRPILLDAPAAPTWTDSDRMLRDRVVNLPGGSDAQAAYQVSVRLRRARVPRDIVMSVLRLLFGQPEKDDCRAVETRLMNSDPGVSREIDLVKFRRTCEGGR